MLRYFYLDLRMLCNLYLDFHMFPWILKDLCVIWIFYGVLKARFPILKQMAPFSFPIQRDIVIACFVVHNFIRKCNIYDQLFMDYDENTMFHEMQSGENGLLVQDMEWGSQGIDYMNVLLRPDCVIWIFYDVLYFSFTIFHHSVYYSELWPNRYISFSSEG